MYEASQTTSFKNISILPTPVSTARTTIETDIAGAEIKRLRRANVYEIKEKRFWFYPVPFQKEQSRFKNASNAGPETVGDCRA